MTSEGREVAAVWVEERKKRLIQSLIFAMNIWLPADSHAWGLMLFPDYNLLHTHTHTQIPPPNTQLSGLKQQSGSCSSRLPGHKGNSSY